MSYIAAALAELDAVIDPDPVAWCEGRGAPLWSKQIQIARAVEQPGARVIVPSCNGSGKTHLAADLAAHFALRWRHEDAMVVIIGSSWDQLRDGTHALIGAMELGSGVEELRERYLRIDGKRAIVWRSPPKGWSAARPRKLLQGLHRRRMLVIIEEANEIPPSLWTEATTAVVSGGVSHVLAILNPTDTGTPAHQATESGAWVVVPIGVDDTPNFTGEAVSAAARNALPTRAWAEEQQRALTPGEYRARVLGEWPERSEYALIETEWIDTAMARDAPKEEANGNAYRVGWCFDPGSGGDPNTVVERKGSVVRRVDLPRDVRFSSDREAVSRDIALVMEQRSIDRITVDTFGVGADHAVHLAALGKRVTSINSGDRQKLTAAQAKIYDNPRAVWAWSLRKLMQEGAITLPNDRDVRRQLIELRQKPHAGGKLALEPKADMAARLGRSPDDLDAILLSCHDPDATVVKRQKLKLWR